MGVVEPFRLDGHALPFQQAQDARLPRLRPPVDERFLVLDLVRVVVQRLGIGGDEPLEVAQHDLAGGLADHVVGHDRNLAAAARRVDDVLGHGVARGVAAQPLDDLDALADRRPQMAGAFHQVALVEVVGAHANLDQVVHQFALDVDGVVDPGQQHALVAQRNAGPRQPVGRRRQLRGDLLGVVDVDVEPERVVLLDHVAELRRHAHGQEDGHARADADDLDVGDGPQAAEDHVQQLGGQHHRVAAAQQHVADLRRAFDIVDLGVELGPAEGLGGIADDAAAGAVAAVAGALGGDEHQHPVGVAVDEAGHGRVFVLGQAVFHHRLERNHLAVGGDDLLADGAMGVIGVDEAGEVGGDIDAKQPLGGQGAALRVGQVDDAGQFVGRVEPVGHLPAPVHPLLIGHVGPIGGAGENGVGQGACGGFGHRGAPNV